MIDGTYRRLESTEGVFRSQVFPGLWIDPAAVIAADAAAVLRTLQQGLDSPSHREFVNRLLGKKNE